MNKTHTLQFLLLNEFLCKDWSNIILELVMSDKYQTFLGPSDSLYSTPVIPEDEWRGGHPWEIQTTDPPFESFAPVLSPKNSASLMQRQGQDVSWHKE